MQNIFEKEFSNMTILLFWDSFFDFTSPILHSVNFTVWSSHGRFGPTKVRLKHTDEISLIVETETSLFSNLMARNDDVLITMRRSSDKALFSEIVLEHSQRFVYRQGRPKMVPNQNQSVAKLKFARDPWCSSLMVLCAENECYFKSS